MQDVSGLLDRLLGFLELGKACVTSETLIQIKDVLRRYPHVAEVAISSLNSLSPQVSHTCRSCLPAAYAVALPLTSITGMCKDDRVVFVRWCCGPNALQQALLLPGHYCRPVGFAMSLISQDVEEAEARAAFIWILGEHGSGIQVSNFFKTAAAEMAAIC